MDILGDENKEDKVNAVLPSTQASQPGSSTGGETQPYPSPREVDLHEIRNRAAATLSRMTGGRRGICLTGKYCLLVRHSPGLHQAADSCCRGMYAGNEGLLG